MEVLLSNGSTKSISTYKLYFDQLPQELLIEIFLYLDISDIDNIVLIDSYKDLLVSTKNWELIFWKAFPLVKAWKLGVLETIQNIYYFIGIYRKCKQTYGTLQCYDEDIKKYQFEIYKPTEAILKMIFKDEKLIEELSYSNIRVNLIKQPEWEKLDDEAYDALNEIEKCWIHPRDLMLYSDKSLYYIWTEMKGGKFNDVTIEDRRFRITREEYLNLHFVHIYNEGSHSYK